MILLIHPDGGKFVTIEPYKVMPEDVILDLKIPKWLKEYQTFINMKPDGRTPREIYNYFLEHGWKMIMSDNIRNN